MASASASAFLSPRLPTTTPSPSVSPASFTLPLLRQARGGAGCRRWAGERYMFPHAKAMIQQPRIPAYGMMQASDVVIRAVRGDRVAYGHFDHFDLATRQISLESLTRFSGAARRSICMADMLSSDEWDKVAGVRRPDLM